jgi:hypothetical protein
LRHRNEFDEKRSALAAQRSKLAAALRTERLQCDAACREVFGLAAVLTANGIPDAAAAEQELGSMPGGDAAGDFPSHPHISPSCVRSGDRSAILAAVAGERDRLTRRLAEVGRRHDAANSLNQVLSAQLRMMREERSGSKEGRNAPGSRTQLAGLRSSLVSPFERLLVALQ